MHSILLNDWDPKIGERLRRASFGLSISVSSETSTGT